MLISFCSSFSSAGTTPILNKMFREFGLKFWGDSFSWYRDVFFLASRFFDLFLGIEIFFVASRFCILVFGIDIVFFLVSSHLFCDVGIFFVGSDVPFSVARSFFGIEIAPHWTEVVDWDRDILV